MQLSVIPRAGTLLLNYMPPKEVVAMATARVCLGLTFALLVAAPAGAIPVTVTVQSLDDQGFVRSQSDQYDASDPDDDGIYTYDLSDLSTDVASTSAWLFEAWSGSVNPDPSISNTFGVTNLLPGKQSFTITIETIVGPIGAPTTLTGGSAQGGVTDTNGNGATLSTSGLGTSFYTSLLDGADFEDLYVDPSSVTVGASQSGNLSPLEDFGVPIPSLAGPGVANSIGIRFQFDLTGSDQASGSGVFVVEPVPEPRTGILLSAGLLLALACRACRRRQ